MAWQDDVRRDLRGKQGLVTGLGRNLGELAQGVPPPAQTPRIGLRGPMPDLMPGAWNAAGRGGRRPHWNDPSGKPYSPGPRPGIDYDTRGSAPTFDDWLMNWSKRFGG